MSRGRGRETGEGQDRVRQRNGQKKTHRLPERSVHRERGIETEKEIEREKEKQTDQTLRGRNKDGGEQM